MSIPLQRPVDTCSVMGKLTHVCVKRSKVDLDSPCRCLMRELGEKACCPVCGTKFFVRLDVEN